MRNKLRTFLGFMIWGWLILTLIISVGYHLFFQQEREARINDLLNQLNAIQKLDEYRADSPHPNKRQTFIAVSASKNFYVPQNNHEFFPVLTKNLTGEGWTVNNRSLYSSSPALIAQKGVYKLTIRELHKDAQYNWIISIHYDDIFEKFAM